MKQQGAGNAILMLCALLGVSERVKAGDLTVESAITVDTIVSDNIDQAPQSEAESDLRLGIRPLFSLRSQAARLNWNLDLGAEARAFLNSTDVNRIDPQIQGRAEAEVLPENLFLEGLVNLRQSFATGRARGGDGRGAGLAEDQTDVFSLSLGPIWRSDLEGYAQVVGTYRYEYIRANDVVDATHIQRVGLEAVSDRELERLDWALSYQGEWSKGGQGEGDNAGDDNRDTLSRQVFRAEADYQLNDDWALSAAAGYDGGEGNNTRGEEAESGVYWSVGGTWNPSRIFAFKLLLGPDDREFYFTFSPTRRTDLAVSVIDREVGRDAGVTWDGRLIHRTRHSNWVLLYEETNTSQAETEVADVVGDPAFDEVDDVFNPGSTLGLTDEQFFRRRLQASVDYNRGRTRIELRGAFEQREFAEDGDAEQTWEAGLTWEWLVGRRTSTVLTLDWEDAEFRDDRTETFLSFGLGLTYLFSEDLQGLIGFTHLNRDTADDADDFQENRLGLLLRMEF